MAAWVKEGENSFEHRQRKEAEEAGKVEVAPGVTVASSRRFRATSTAPIEKPETLRVRSVVDAMPLGAWLRFGEGIGWLAADTTPNSLPSSICFCHVVCVIVPFFLPCFCFVLFCFVLFL